MNKTKIREQIEVLEANIDNSERYIVGAKAELEDLKKELEKLDKKPYIYWHYGDKHEIVRYKKYSQHFIEFETETSKYRYITLQNNNEHIFPTPRYKTISSTSGGYAFEMYYMASCTYKTVHWIDHIELLEGVDEYDKNRT